MGNKREKLIVKGAIDMNSLVPTEEKVKVCFKGNACTLSTELSLSHARTGCESK